MRPCPSVTRPARSRTKGSLGVVEYMESLGEGASRRARLVDAMQHIARYERGLCLRLINRLQEIPEVTIYGLTAEADMADRVPTVILDVEGISARSVAEYLGARNIFVWDGDYYAIEVIDALGHAPSGGLVRIGLAHYNTAEEVDRVCDTLANMVVESGVRHAF